MAEDDDIVGLAGEYVLGTLDAAERDAISRRLGSDPALAEAVTIWQERLTPLALQSAGVTPPSYVRGAVLRRIAGDSADSSTVVGLRRKLALWRGGAIAASALAAGLAAVLIIEPLLQKPSPQGSYVAVLQPEGPGPAFIASIDVAAGTISVRRVGAEAQKDKSYELWAVGGGRDKPQSLGVIDASLKLDTRKLGNVDSAALGQTVFAISLEPPGGSPTGQPTGPVMFTGKLVPTE